MKSLGLDGVSLNRETIDLRYVEQLRHGEQSAALGLCLRYAHRHLLDGGGPCARRRRSWRSFWTGRGWRPCANAAAGCPSWPGPGSRRSWPASTAIAAWSWA